MRPIDRVSPVSPIRRVVSDRIEPVSDSVASTGTGRSLVALAPSRDAPRPAGRNVASFVAQLIATNRGLPQTRERRRAEPDEARAAYGATVQSAGPGGTVRLAKMA